MRIPLPTTCFPSYRDGVIFPWVLKSKFDVKKNSLNLEFGKRYVSWDFWLWGIKKEGLTFIIGVMKKCWRLVIGFLGYWKRQKQHSVYQVNLKPVSVSIKEGLWTLDSLRFSSSSEVLLGATVWFLYSRGSWDVESLMIQCLFIPFLNISLSFHLENIVINDIFSGNFIVYVFFLISNRSHWCQRNSLGLYEYFSMSCVLCQGI